MRISQAWSLSPDLSEPELELLATLPSSLNMVLGFTVDFTFLSEGTGGAHFGQSALDSFVSGNGIETAEGGLEVTLLDTKFPTSGWA